LDGNPNSIGICKIGRDHMISYSTIIVYYSTVYLAFGWIYSTVLPVYLAFGLAFGAVCGGNR
jgi:hypothetical protein